MNKIVMNFFCSIFLINTSFTLKIIDYLVFNNTLTSNKSSLVFLAINYIPMFLGYLLLIRSIILIIDLAKNGELIYETNKIINEIKKSPEVNSINTQPSNDSYTGEVVLDNMIFFIKNKILLLQKNKHLSDKDRFILEKTMVDYVPQIVQEYINTFPNLRKIKKLDKTTQFETTRKKLETISQELSIIEKSILSENHHQQKILEKFLESRFK